jgi:hypothetical protein
MTTEINIFETLQASLKEVAEIRKGTANPSRVFKFGTASSEPYRTGHCVVEDRDRRSQLAGHEPRSTHA